MKKLTNLLLILISFSIVLSGCASKTLIDSEPSGAKLYIDGIHVGKTPYNYSDTKIVGSTTSVKMKKRGYKDFTGFFTRSEQAEVGPIIGGCIALVPFLWCMGYNPERTYELEKK